MAWRRTVAGTAIERFVAVLVAGGTLLVAGLWVARVAAAGSPAWVVGVVFAGVGTLAVVVGIAAGVDVGPLAP